FSGIQDDVPISQTSTKSQYLELTHGLDFGPSIGPRWGGGGTDVGSELNAVGFNASSLAQAITNGDYITFSVDPVAGAGIIPTTVSFQLWRNGNVNAGTSASAPNYAILSSATGFTTSNILSQATYSDFSDKSHNFSAAQHTLTASLPA